MSQPTPSLTRAALWLAIAALCAGCASVKRADASHQSAFSDRLQALASQRGVCNIAFAIVRQRELHSVDTASLCASSPQGSVFQVASLSKPVFAYAVLQLVAQGRMDLDAPVLQYLPHGYAHRHVAYLGNSPVDLVADPKLWAVTVRMALNHTSGLPNWSGGPLAFEREPGTAWGYSGEGYVLLQRAVEAVTGENLDAFMQRQVFVPLGMTHSAYTHQARLAQDIVPGYAYGFAWKPMPFREPVAAFTLHTSAGDYGRFLAALLKDERALRDILDAPVSVSPKLDLGWGLGWGLERKGGEVSLWHWGNNFGYRAFVMASPRSGDGFVMLTNSESGLSLAEPLGEAVLPGPHQVYRFHLLRDGLSNLLCDRLDICL